MQLCRIGKIKDKAHYYYYYYFLFFFFEEERERRRCTDVAMQDWENKR